MEELEYYLYRSTALMLVRRLLANAKWYVKKNIDRENAYELFERDYLRGTFALDRASRLRLASLVVKSLEASETKIPAGMHRRLREQASSLNERCQILGCQIDYSRRVENGDHNAFTLDHIWPQALGGLSEEWNLRTSCYICNSRRQNVAESADTHYEHFHVHSDYSDESRGTFWTQLDNNFRIAALMKADFRCEECDTVVSKMAGNAHFARKNVDENYNVFNIQVLCERHASRRLPRNDSDD